MKAHLYIYLSLVFLFSCKKEMLNKSQLFVMEPFNQIELDAAFNVFLLEDSVYSVEMLGDEKIIECIELKAENNVLRISNKRKAQWITPRKNKIELYIKSKPLKEITAAEGCNIQTLSPITSPHFGLILSGKVNEANLELDTDNFYFWNAFPCGGKLTLSGNTESLKLWNFALMSIDAKNLHSKNALVENNATGDCEVSVWNKLEYKIEGRGNIVLYGDVNEILDHGTSSASAGILIRY